MPFMPSLVRRSARDFAQLANHVLSRNVALDEATLNTPYINTIAPEDQPIYPGDIEIEERIEQILRWNAIAMVLQAQDKGIGVGGHIATYASCATMLEVGFNHFFRGAGPDNDRGAADMLPQPHAAPGVYAGLFRRPVVFTATAKLSSRVGRGRRAVVLSSPSQHAGVLGGAERLNGLVDTICDLSSAVCQVP